ncbi:peptidylprolyl isomerase [Formosa sp. Hel1_31_208]|uniref:peptidylprolyl isomerase n=1 Tax=Formosa sp. Hel1_31_208 TaxID=1798225 RepID=UPI001E4CE82F|nr:peptidylprolyl isomerase [Formosa sp. Hel1_31_208]
MKVSITAILFFMTCFSQAQVKNNDVIFTVDGDPVMASEFIRVYNKNLDLVQDESQKDVDAYLDLFINYQLKVKEARRLGLDKDSKYIKEFNNYKNQLTKNFMADSKVTDALVKEAYERTINDVKASHILIRIDENETDTLVVYNRMLKLRQRVINEGYEAVQKEVHNGQTIFAEDLGYFGGFKMVYPFETVAFETPVGEVSMPFRTRFGYHIVKVFDKRKALGEVTVAHIMVSQNQKDSTTNPENRIKQIYQKIQQGEKFQSLAKQFSDDKSSSSKGGELALFTGGQLSSKVFEDVAFSLENSGDISQPFQSDYGWHIIKLIRKKGLRPFEEMKVELQNKVKRDSRSKLINSALAKQLASKYTAKVNKDTVAYFKTIMSDAYFNQAWKVTEDFNSDGIIMTLGNRSVRNKEFMMQLMKNQRNYFKKNLPLDVVVDKELDIFFETQVLKYHEDNLEFENEDFAFVLKEYRDGLLLFDLMEKEVWNAATKDTLGLESFYKNNKDKYVWQDRADMVIMSSASKTNVEKVKQSFEKGISVEDIMSTMNIKGELNIISTAGIFEQGHPSLPENFKFKEGISQIYNHNDAFHVIIVKSLLPAGFKTLEEARGKVVSDYQNFIEENWVIKLNERYDVKVDPTVLNRVKKQIQNN